MNGSQVLKYNGLCIFLMLFMWLSIDFADMLLAFVFGFHAVYVCLCIDSKECLCLCVCIHAEARGQLWIHYSGAPSQCFWDRYLTGLELTKWARLVGQRAAEICLSLLRLWLSKSTCHYSQFYFMWTLGTILWPSCLQALYPVSYLSSHHKSYDSFLWEHKLSARPDDSCFEWGVVFRSTYSQNVHNYLVKIQWRWWWCTLSQSRLWSDAGVVTYGPCVTCFYKLTFIGIQQASLYCCSICFCANPSWAQ